MNTILKTIFTFLAGAVVGAITGILTAPRSGKDTREKVVNDIKFQKEQLEDVASKKLEEAKMILNQSIEKSKKATKKQIDRVAETIKVSDN